jgi:transcriptional regulator with XRE-family HTH domain
MPTFLSSNLILLRKEKGLTQAEAAQVLGLKRNTYANYESGHTEPDLTTLVNISQFFGIATDKLLSMDLQNVNLNENRSVEKNAENVNPNVNRNVNLTPQNPLTLAHRQAAEVPPLWAIGMLQKLEQLAADMEALKKDDNNAESRVGAA